MAALLLSIARSAISQSSLFDCPVLIRRRWQRQRHECELALRIAVLSDINMPGMDGLELLAEIKQRFPDLPVMMVTAYGDDDRRRRASELGAFEFIPKPVDFDQLKAQLRQLPAAAD